MKYVFSVLILVLVSLFGTAFAASPDALVSSTDLSSVVVSDVSSEVSGRVLTLGFTLTSASGVQPGVQYGVALVSGEGSDARVVYEYAHDEILMVSEASPVKRSLVFVVPTALEGEFTTYLMIKNDKGFVYGVSPLKALTVTEEEAVLSLDRESCYVTSGDDRTQFESGERALGEATDALVSHCLLTNTTDGVVTVTPRYITKEGSLYGKTIPGIGGSSAAFELAPKETKQIATELPRMSDGTYAVTVQYDGMGNEMTYQYSSGNTSASIDTLFLDKTLYGAGDTARISVVTSADGDDHMLAVSLQDDAGAACSESAVHAVQEGNYARADIALPVTTACRNVVVHATLMKDGSLVDQVAMRTQSPAVSFLPPQISVEESNGALNFGASFWVCIITFALGAGYLYYRLYKKSIVETPSEPLMMILLMLLAWAIFGATSVEAASFIQDGCAVSTSLDRNVHVRTGETITVSGYTSCPGITITAALQNAGYGFSATTNSVGFFSGSFAAPSANDNLSYTSGDPTNGPITPEPMYPYDPVFVNRCIPAMTNYCEHPGEETYGLGVAVGWSGGSCTTGSGTCNYTCQSDLTWRENSNSCGTPPPPPPGSTPEFTTPLTCSILANASSCTGTVTVNVPSTYPFGASLTRCDGTALEYFTPGTHTVSVVVPYNTVCLNLSPWSFIPVPPTDTITGSSNCTNGTTWDGTKCAPTLLLPTTPTGLSVTPSAQCGTKTITASWNAVTGATGYDLERDGVLISGILGTSYSDIVGTDGSSHTYRVRAWNTAGPSAWSATQSANAPTPCPAATGSLSVTSCVIAANQNSCSASVTWTTTGATAPSVTWNGSTISTLPTQSGMSQTAVYGVNTFRLLNGSVELGIQSFTAVCANGTSWNGSVCELDSTPPSNLPCNASEILGCVLDPTAHGATDGTCNPSTHTGTCSYTCSDGTWGAPSANNCSLINVVPPVVSGPPVLRASNRIVRAGTPVTLSWDTNNGDEGLCSLTGPTIGNTYAPLPRAGTGEDAERGTASVTVVGRSTYTLSCPSSGSASVTIEIIPEDSET